MYVAVEPSKVPSGVVTVVPLTGGGDPQSADGRSHSQNVSVSCTFYKHTAIDNSPSRGELLLLLNLLEPTYTCQYVNVIAIAGIILGH